MSKRVLFLVHVENSLVHLMPRGYLHDVCKHIDSSDYDRVYHFSSGLGLTGDDVVDELKGWIDEEIDWAWGYEPEVFEHNPEELPYVIESSGHDYTWIPPFLRDSSLWNGVDITLGGGCDSECLQDMVCVLNHQQIAFNKVRNLVYP